MFLPPVRPVAPVQVPAKSLIDMPVAYTQAQELMCAERVMDMQDSLPEIVFYEDHLPLCAYLSAYKKEELLRH